MSSDLVEAKCQPLQLNARAAAMGNARHAIRWVAINAWRAVIKLRTL
ncbi:hypothetical protein [Sphingomonas aurantiaca]